MDGVRVTNGLRNILISCQTMCANEQYGDQSQRDCVTTAQCSCSGSLLYPCCYCAGSKLFISTWALTSTPNSSLPSAPPHKPIYSAVQRRFRKHNLTMSPLSLNLQGLPSTQVLCSLSTPPAQSNPFPSQTFALATLSLSSALS